LLGFVMQVWTKYASGVPTTRGSAGPAGRN
jgi:hypothetical protein